VIVILGGGLAGLATAHFLGERTHVVLEAEETPGGLCRSREVEGFLFDYTGHLLHLRDPRVVALMDAMLPGAFETIERKAVIRTRGVTLPFPFQANLHGLPKEVVLECIVGAAEALASPVPEDPLISFRDWSLAVLGKGISDAFLFPYNTKLFRRDPAEMTADWVSWAVPRPNLREVVRGALGVENVGMGYNSTFRYPREGGIGILPDAFAARLGTVRTRERVVRVDLDRREVACASGTVYPYESLVNTLPLPAFLRMLEGGPARELRPLADRLDWSVVGCLNLGIARDGVGDGVHWCYFPDGDAPFYRVGYPHNVVASTCPPGTSSLYVEFGLKRGEAADPGRLERVALEALRREGILRETDRIVVRDFVRIDPGYVIFDRARQEVMTRAMPLLAGLGIHAIGRYGAWTYSYMERAMLDGLETAERLAAV
jgi:protoporphyrinogen oxidase